MIGKLLTEHHFEFLGLKGGCRGSSEFTHVKMPHCWKSHALAHYYFIYLHSPKLTTFMARQFWGPFLTNMFKTIHFITNITLRLSDPRRIYLRYHGHVTKMSSIANNDH